MHEFDFRFDFKDWTDEQIEQLIKLLEEVGDYDKRDVLLNYLYPAREELITVIDVEGKKTVYSQLIRGW